MEYVIARFRMRNLLRQNAEANRDLFDRLGAFMDAEIAERCAFCDDGEKNRHFIPDPDPQWITQNAVADDFKTRMRTIILRHLDFREAHDDIPLSQDMLFGGVVPPSSSEMRKQDRYYRRKKALDAGIPVPADCAKRTVGRRKQYKTTAERDAAHAESCRLASLRYREKKRAARGTP